MTRTQGTDWPARALVLVTLAALASVLLVGCPDGGGPAKGDGDADVDGDADADECTVDAFVCGEGDGDGDGDSDGEAECGPDCMLDDLACNGAAVERCRRHMVSPNCYYWEPVETCPSEEECRQYGGRAWCAGDCVDSCEPGPTSCEGSVLWECVPEIGVEQPCFVYTATIDCADRGEACVEDAIEGAACR